MCAPPPRSAPALGWGCPPGALGVPRALTGHLWVALCPGRATRLTWSRAQPRDRPQRRLSPAALGPLVWVEVGHPRGAGLPSAQSSAALCPLQRPPAPKESCGGGGLGNTAGPGWRMPVLGPEPGCVGLGERVGWGREVATASISQPGLQVRPAPCCPWKGIPGPQLPGTLCPERHTSCPRPALTPYRPRDPEGQG